MEFVCNVPHKFKAGRPIEFSKEDHDNIVYMASKTLVLNNISGMVGRSRETIKRWLKRGEEEHAAGQLTDFAQFYADFKEAVAKFVLSLESRLIEGDEQRWQRIAWYLERTCREDYGAESGIIAEILRNFEIIKAAQEGAKNNG